MYKPLITVLMWGLLIATTQVNAQARGESKTDSLYSNILSEQRELLIQLPNSYKLNKSQSYPVLYLLDGTRNFNHAVGTLDLLNQSYMAQEMIIVAIKNTDRTRDFTPTYNESYNRWGISGGAEKFLDFMEKELIPYVNKTHRTNGLKILSGHSFGGLLSVYAFQSRPGLFQAHFAFSPSLWWHDEVLFDTAKNVLTNTKDLNNYLYINMGTEGGMMLSAFEKYQQLLAEHAPKGLRYKTELVEDENHNTTAMVGHNPAYRDLFAMFQCPEDIQKQGLEAIQTFYKALSKDLGYEVKPPYSVIKDAGHYALNDKNVDKAINLFQHNIDTFPHIADAYFRIAFALEQNAQLEKALIMVDKAIALSKVENVEQNAFEYYRTYLKQEIAK
ncbi:alpha/beta hydrolase [Thalassotalea marina]|uniref:Periplasmic siderophore cleavage esterase IroE family protein n=1 Tax=Thalassotalea marina TaxID=1673741 RepID=A0A919ENX3_9GAMM|nr:alpha/beta hydrolase-fold protein [Thalassotalea marina]GHG04326.1 periplasmic siderophore cleavage esterase IroE family protein [Thalassotalea marina]